jgi:tRNA(Leu) C34 or U34 (ribose-2'-O)-methylase TrmL
MAQTLRMRPACKTREGARSLNLATVVCAGVYEALRQLA